MIEFNSKALKLIHPNDTSSLLEALSDLHLKTNDLENMSKAAITEAKKFLRKENEVRVVEFINKLFSSTKKKHTR